MKVVRARPAIALREGPHEERHRRGLDAVEHELEKQRGHQRALGVVHPVAVPEPLRRAGRGHQTSLAVALDEVLEDRAGLGERDVAVRDHRRLSERVDLPERRRREHRLRVALVVLDLVGNAELFEQPEHALRARVVQVMDGEHGRSSSLSFSARDAASPRASQDTPPSPPRCGSPRGGARACRPGTGPTPRRAAGARAAPRAGR